MSRPNDVWVAELRGPIHGRIAMLRGMCSDGLPHAEIDAKLATLDDLVYALSMAVEFPPSEPSPEAMRVARQRFGVES